MCQLCISESHLSQLPLTLKRRREPRAYRLGEGEKGESERRKEEEGGHRNGQKYCTSTSFFKNRFLFVKLMLICSSWMCRAHFKHSNDVFHFIPWAIQAHFSNWFFQTTSQPRLPPPNNHKPNSCCWQFYAPARIGPLLLILTGGYMWTRKLLCLDRCKKSTNHCKQSSHLILSLR